MKQNFQFHYKTIEHAFGTIPFKVGKGGKIKKCLNDQIYIFLAVSQCLTVV